MVAKRSKSATSAKARTRWPKGSPKAGQFAKTEDLPLIKEFLAAQRRAEKNRKEREKRKAERAERMKRMAPNVTGSRVNDTIKGWGSTSTARVKETQKMYWHGAFTISGLSDAELRRILQAAGSGAKTPTRNDDGGYTVTLTPGYGWQNPKGAFAGDDDGKTWLDARMEHWTREFSAPGVTVTYHGAFYNPHRK